MRAATRRMKTINIHCSKKGNLLQEGGPHECSEHAADRDEEPAIRSISSGKQLCERSHYRCRHYGGKRCRRSLTLIQMGKRDQQGHHDDPPTDGKQAGQKPANDTNGEKKKPAHRRRRPRHRRGTLLRTAQSLHLNLWSKTSRRFPAYRNRGKVECPCCRTNRRKTYASAENILPREVPYIPERARDCTSPADVRHRMRVNPRRGEAAFGLPGTAVC